MTDAHCHVRRYETRHFICDPQGTVPGADMQGSVPDAEGVGPGTGGTVPGGGDVLFKGWHPWFPEGFDADALAGALASDTRLGVGEIGLDRLRAKEIPVGMREMFAVQLEIAAEFSRPVVLHGAKCWGEVVKACRPYAGRIPAFLFHGFSRSGGLLSEIEKMNGFISVGPAILNDHAVNYRELARTIPAGMLLVESDATPENFREAPSASSVAAGLAAVRGVPAEEMARTLEENADAFVRALSASPRRRSPETAGGL